MHTDDTLVGTEADIAMKGHRLTLYVAKAGYGSRGGARNLSASVGVTAAFVGERLLVLRCLPPVKCWGRCGAKSLFCATASPVQWINRRLMKCCASRAKIHNNDLTWAGSTPLSAIFIPPQAATNSSNTMSLNTVSEHLLAANGLSHQGAVLHSWSTDRTPSRLRRSLFPVELSRITGFEGSIIKDGSYNIDGALACAPSAAKKKPVCLCPD